MFHKEIGALLIGLVTSACISQRSFDPPQSQNPPLVAPAVEAVNFQQYLSNLNQETDETLMIVYGAGLRTAFRTGNYEIVTSPDFLKLEAEVEQRQLISRGIPAEIERGIVYAGMPLVQALASIDNLVEVDSLILDNSLVRSFQGSATAALGSQISLDTFISCNGSIVTLFAASGLITSETYNQTFGSTRIRFQTNFPPGFWDEANLEERTRGNRVFDRPTYFADRREHRWSLFSNNSGRFVKPSVWYETGATSYNPRINRRNINDMMNGHIRRGGSVC